MALNLGSIYYQLGADVSGLNNASKYVKGFQQNTTRDFNKVNQAASSLKQTIGALITVETIRRSVLMADSYANVRDRVHAAVGEVEKGKAVFSELEKVAGKTGSKINTIADGFQKISFAKEALHTTNKDILQVTKTFANLGMISRASTTQMDTAILQFSQGLVTGTFQAQEFQSVMESIPLILPYLAEGMGLTTSELIKMKKEGKLLSSEVFAGLLKQTDKIAEAAGTVPVRLSVGIPKFMLGIQQMLGGLDDATGMTGKLGKGFFDAGEKIKNIPNGILAAKNVIADFLEQNKGIMAMSKEAKTLATQFLAVSVAVLLAEKSIGILTLAFGGLQSVVAVATSSFALFALPGAVVAGIVGSVVLVVSQFESLADVVDFTTSSFEDSQKAIYSWSKLGIASIQSFIDYGQKVLKPFSEMITEIGKMMLSPLAYSSDTIRDKISGLWSDVKKAHTEGANETKKTFEKATADVAEFKQTFEKQLSSFGPSPSTSNFKLFDFDFTGLDTVKSFLSEYNTIMSDQAAKEIARLKALEKEKEDLKQTSWTQRMGIDAYFNDIKNRQSAKLQKDELGRVGASFAEQISLAGESSKAFFELSKALSVAQIILKTPQVIADAYAWGNAIAGPPGGVISAGIGAGAMGVQLASAMSANFTPRAIGGDVFPNQTYKVNENGPEMFSFGGSDYLSTGSKRGFITPADNGASQIDTGVSNLGSSGSTPNITKINVNVYPTPGETATIKETTAPDGSQQLDIIMEKIDVALSKGIRDGLSSTGDAIQSVFGLNRGAGAFA